MFAATLDAPVATSSLVSGGGTGLLIAERPKNPQSIKEHVARDDDDDDDDDDGPIDLTMGKIGGGGGGLGLLDLGLSRGDSPKSDHDLPRNASSPGDDGSKAGMVWTVYSCVFDCQILTGRESAAIASRNGVGFRV